MMDGQPTDDGGLGSISGRTSELRIPQWRHINTDRMTLEYAPVKTPVQTNGPVLGGIRPRLEEHRNDIIASFQGMYQFLLEQRVALLANESPLHDFKDRQVRFLYRSTRIYGAILQKQLKPRCLRDGVEWSMQLELLGRALLPPEGTLGDRRELTRWWPIFAAERQAMMQGDTPFFTAHTSGDALEVAPDQNIESCFEASSYDKVVARIKALSSEDMDRQVSFIAGSLYSYVARDVTLEPAVSSIEMEAGSDTRRNVSSQEWVAQALAIAEQLSRRAIRGAGGSAIWIAPQYLVQARRYQFGPVSYNLYSGTCGVGLFLGSIRKDHLWGRLPRTGFREHAVTKPGHRA